jgi:hypothetical protein
MGSSSAPTVAAVTTPPPIPAIQTPAAIQASTDIQQRASAAIGPGAMDQTGPNGLTTPANTGTKTLLGS